MAKSNKIRFFLLVAFFTFAILPAQGLKVTVNNANGDSVITGKYDDEAELWTSKSADLWCMPETLKAIFVVADPIIFTQLMAPNHKNKRLEIQNDLAEKKYLLFYLKIEEYNRGVDDDIIWTFIKNKIRKQNIKNIEMIGLINKKPAEHKNPEDETIVGNLRERLDEMVPAASCATAFRIGFKELLCCK